MLIKKRRSEKVMPYLSTVFLYVEGEYDKNREIAKIPRGGACFIWEINGEGAYLAVNEERSQSL